MYFSYFNQGYYDLKGDGNNTLLTDLFTRLKINDSTSGYKCINAEVLKQINLKKVKSQGYSFQVEINFLASVKKFKIKEIPIIFHDRTIGESKMSKKIILEAIFMVPKLALRRLFRLW